MQNFIVYKLVNNFVKRYSTSITIIENLSPISTKLENKETDSLTLKELLACDIKALNTKTITDVLYSSAYKFEDGIRYSDSSVYDVSQSKQLEFFYLYLLSKARFLKHEQILPILRSYDIFQLSILNAKCWEIIGRILNNCINIYTDPQLIEICYHLTRITSIPHNIKEIEIFWQRVIIQSPNWFNHLHKLDILTLIYLLHISKNKPFEVDNVDKVVESIRDAEDLFYKIEELPTVSFLIEVLINNDIFDQEIVKNSTKLISNMSAKDLSNIQSLADFASLIWNYGRLMMANRNCKSCLADINARKLESLIKKTKSLNGKLFIKLNKGLFLLGLSSEYLPTSDIDPRQLDPVYESDIIDACYSTELVRDPLRFFGQYSRQEFEKVNLPYSIKAFYLLSNNIPWLAETTEFQQYVGTVVTARQSLSGFLTLKPSQPYELIVEYSNHAIGIVPCEFVDFIYPDASNTFLTNLAGKYDGIPVYKVCCDDLADLSTEEKQQSFICRYFPRNV